MRETILCLSSEGKLHVYNIPQMLNHSLEIIKLRLKRGEDLSTVQTLLELVDRLPFEVKVKSKQLKNTEPFELVTDSTESDTMKGLKMIRVNQIAGKNSLGTVN